MAYRPTEKTEARKDARRKHWLETATRLFGEHGYHATTVPMIVAEAGSSTGSFYMYFKNKEDGFVAALEALGDQVTAVMEQAHRENPDPIAEIRLSVESLFLFLARNPRQARMLIVESSGLSPRLEKVRRDILGGHARRVVEAIEANLSVFTSEYPAVAARCLVGAVFESLCSWLETAESERLSAEEIARVTAEYNIKALTAARR
jgi:TetR/AcrR family transcriptional regulator, fatty acid metabolism regulator protein